MIEAWYVYTRHVYGLRIEFYYIPHEVVKRMIYSAIYYKRFDNL